MKNMIFSQFFILALALNLSFYTNTTASLKEREQTTKKVVCQKLQEGMSTYEIVGLLYNLVEQTPEYATQHQVNKQYNIAASQLKECKQTCSTTYCQTLEQEYVMLYEQCRHKLRPGYSIDSDTEKARSKLDECRKNCSTINCKNLEQEVDKLEQKRRKANEAVWNTPEGKLHKKLSLLVHTEEEIRIINYEISNIQKNIKIKKEELQDQEKELRSQKETLLDSLKAELSQ